MSVLSVHIDAQLPEDELEGLLQVLRSWDRGRDSVRLAIKITGESSAPLDDLMTMFKRLDPPMPFVGMVPIDKATER